MLIGLHVFTLPDFAKLLVNLSPHVPVLSLKLVLCLVHTFLPFLLRLHRKRSWVSGRVDGRVKEDYPKQSEASVERCPGVFGIKISPHPCMYGE